MKVKSQKSKVKSAGFVLPFAVLLSGILLSIGLAIFSITLKELILSSAGRESQFAFFAADAGAECALYWDVQYPGFSTTIFDRYEAGTSTPDTVFSIGYDASSGNDRENTTNMTYTHTIGSEDNRILTVGVAVEDGSATDCSVTSVTYGGAPLTKITSVNASGSGSTYMCTSLWYLLSPPTGSASVSVTTAGTVSEIASGSISLYNAAQQAPESFNTNTATNQSSISTSLTTITDGSWVIDAMGSGEEQGFSPGSGQTERYDRQGDSMEGAGSTKEIASAGATNISWSNGDTVNRIAHVVAAFAPYVEGGSETGGVPHESVPQNSNAQCGGVDITNPASGWDPNIGWDSTLSGIVPVVTTFDMSFQNGTCATVTVTKDNGATRIDSRGYNTCDLNSTRRVERGLRVRY